MEYGKIDAKTLKGCVDWLKKEGCGCCHVKVCDTEKREIDICVGWHDFGDDWKVCCKIGMQTFNNALQCDLDVDFDMPYDFITGDVFDTLEEVVCTNLKQYQKLAARMNAQAKEAVKFWKEQEMINGDKID